MHPAVLSLNLALAATGAAAGPCQPIAAVPHTISAPGCYRLTADVQSDEGVARAITIAADDVTLDLGGHTLAGPRAAATTTTGVYALDRKRLVVRNGTLTGFRYGLVIASASGRSEGHRVTRLRVSHSRALGLSVAGARSTISQCVVTDVGRGGPSAIGISQSGAESVVRGNVVLRTAGSSPGGFAAGIQLLRSLREPLQVNGNVVGNVAGASTNYGIRCGSDYSAGNRVVGADVPFSDCPYDTSTGGGYPYPYPYPYPYNPYPYYPYPFGGGNGSYGVVGAALVGLALSARKLAFWRA